jgi:hypothetical protein
LEKKSLCGHILDLKIKIWFPLKTHERGIYYPTNFFEKLCGYSKNSWRAKTMPIFTRLGSAVVDQIKLGCLNSKNAGIV